ncbi:MAG TPA: apolipoprotein N-acyltransferase [Jiangellaceae bacterium]
MDRFARPAAAIGAGVALILAFQPYDAWFLAVPIVAVFSYIVRGQSVRQSALLGLLFGLGFFVPFLPWVGLEVGPIPWLVLAAAQALFFVPLGIAVMLVQRLPAWPVLVGAVWVADEAIRSRIPYGGFPWGKLAFSQVDGPMLGLAALGGSVLVSFGVATAGALLAWAAVERPAPHRIAAVAGAAGIVGVGVLVPATEMNGRTATVALIQGSAPGQGLDFNAERRVILENHVEGTHELAAQVANGSVRQPDVVIWPENSSDINPFNDPDVHADISDAVDAIGVPTLIGTIVPTADQKNIENTSIVWHPDTGPGETYVKRHPMPFGEYIPFRSIAELISPEAVSRQPRDFVPGDRINLLEMNGARVGPVICFEVAFDNLPRDAVRAGAEFLAVQTNNAGFGYTPMTEQQLAMAQLRAVEHGRWTVVAALAGVSAVVTPDGAVTDRIELFEQDQIVTEIALSDDLTLATRLGEWPEWLLTIAALAAAALGWRARPVREDVEPATPVAESQMVLDTR